jgi:hypothetical protein
MTDLRKPLNRGGLDRPLEDLDATLRRFFRSEMPEPWPAVPAVPASAPRKPQPRRGFRFFNRFALAAAVALFLIGYLTLASRFPTSGDPASDPLKPVVGQKNGVRHGLPPRMPGAGKVEMLRPEIVPLRGGGEAQIRGVREQGPRRTIHLHVERIR